MSTALTPTPQQKEWIDRFVNSFEGGGILGLGTGVGKTLVGVEIARLRGAKRVLIMAPESTFDGWASTVYWQTGHRLKRCANNSLTFSFLPDPTRRDPNSPDYLVEQVKLSAQVCKSNLAACQAGEDGWFFVTRELFTHQTWTKVPVKKNGQPVIDPKTKKPKTRAQRKDVWHAKRAFDIAIVDENQRFAKKGNRGQQSWGALKADMKIASSADWFGGDLSAMHTVAVDVFGQDAIGMNKAEFIDDFLETEYDHFAYNKKAVVGEQIPGLFASTLPLYVTAPPSVTPPEPEVRHVTLSRAERELYDQLEKNYVAIVDDEVLAIEVPLVLRIRLRELSLGMFRVERTGEVNDDGIEKTTITFDRGAPSAKLDEAKAIMAEHTGEKFLIYTHSAKFAHRAAEELGGRAWTGDESKSERGEIKQEFISGGLNVIVATASSMAEGTDGLQSVCSRIIVLSPEDRALVNTQGISRIARQGQKKQVQVYVIQARDTYDDGTLHRLKMRTKQNDNAKGWG